MKLKFQKRFLAFAPIVIVVISTTIALVKGSAPIINSPFFGVRVNESKLSQEVKNFGLVINKIGVALPVMQDVDGQNQDEYLSALEKGLAHHKNTALPGAGNNIFIFGHSSSNVGTGKYAKAFARLDELKKGDIVPVFYEQKRFDYLVKDKKVVEPGETQYLMPTEKEQLTLMTCWPIGTAKQRLIVIAEPKV